MPTIKISDKTKRRLDNTKHTGQSYNGIINELLDEHGFRELVKGTKRYALAAKKEMSKHKGVKNQ